MYGGRGLNVVMAEARQEPNVSLHKVASIYAHKEVGVTLHLGLLVSGTAVIQSPSRDHQGQD